MAQRNEAPYIAHVFVCTNDRQGARKSCADGASARLKDALKDAIATKGWHGKVRVSTAGCLGLCEGGPNVLVYPQKIWFSGASTDALPEILAALERIMGGEA